MNASNAGASLLCSVRERLYAIPIEHVVETMRPLPIEPVAGAPPFVSGLAVVRGVPLPVVDAARLLLADSAPRAPRAGRFVTMRVGQRRIALAVESVVGARNIPVASLQELPPLLRDALAGVVASIGALDAQLLMVLRTLHFVPESLSRSLEAGNAP
jgi:purine-binding chemotaxis protein CheW